MDTPKIKVISTEILSNYKYVLKVVIDYQKSDGEWESQSREVYNRGDAAAVLLYNPHTNMLVLTHQFRLPTYLNGNDTGMLIEACAGLLDQDDPEECAKREIKEETGYEITQVEKVFEAYMSAGSLTEIIHFFIAAYSNEMKVSEGGGLQEEHEYINVLELPFAKAYDMIASGEIKDAKTIMLLQYARLHNLCKN